MGVLIITATVLFIAAVVVFGYRKDYREDPVLFFKTLIGMPLSIALHFTGLKCVVNRIWLWLSRKN